LEAELKIIEKEEASLKNFGLDSDSEICLQEVDLIKK